MGANDGYHDEVAAKIAAYNAQILSDLRAKKGRRRVATERARLGRKDRSVPQATLFGGMATRAESYGQTRRRLAVDGDAPRVPVSVLRRGEVRCVDCDHGLVVRNDRVICPTCGAIFGSAAEMRLIFDQFLGARLVDPKDYP